MKTINERKSTPPPIKRSKTKKIILIFLCVLGGIIILPILLLFAFGLFLGGDEELKKDETIWKEMHFTDEYGATTNEKYVYTDLFGSFSNSATTNSPLKVRLTVSQDSTIEFALFEYGSTMVKDQDHTMNVRQNDTIVYREDYIRIRDNGWGYLASKTYISEYGTYMYEGGKLEFALTEKRDYGGVPSTYRFIIENASIIEDALKILNQDKKNKR